MVVSREYHHFLIAEDRYFFCLHPIYRMEIKKIKKFLKYFKNFSDQFFRTKNSNKLSAQKNYFYG